MPRSVGLRTCGREREREGEREGRRERDRVQNEMTEEERMKNSESVKMKERMSDK